jgi:hypothetical protein
MKMILHILLKDLRRHRSEIALFLLFCVTWTWAQAKPSSWSWMNERNILPFFLFGLWLFITVRVVQGESLVGDREFWSTRPYQWGHLMGEKAIFLGLCLNLPLFIAEVVLLAAAGIPLSWQLVPGLIFLQLEFVFFLTFPAAVLASITESLVQWILSVVGISLFALFLSWLPWSKLPTTLEGDENVAGFLAMALIVPALAFALLWQYARRRVWPARLAAGAAVLVVPLSILAASTRFVRAVAYPPPDGLTPLHVSIPESASGAGRVYERRISELSLDPDIAIPVIAIPADPDTLVEVEGWRITLDGDNAWRWQSPWFNQPFKPGPDGQDDHLVFTMPENLANQLAQAHASGHLDVAFAVYHLGPAHRFETASERFSIPGVGSCGWHRRMIGFGMNGFCVAPLRMPEVMFIDIESADSTCGTPRGAPPLPSGHHASEFQYNSDGLPADFDPNPVRSFSISFGAWAPPIQNTSDPKNALSLFFCRGTPLTVRTGNLTGKTQASFDLGQIGTETVVKNNVEDSE